MSDVNEIAQEMIEEALVSSKRFGSIVPEVDHVRLGEAAKKYRKRAGVFATDVGRILELTKVQINFLESGAKMWDAKTLRRYLSAIERLQAQGKSRSSSPTTKANGSHR